MASNFGLQILVCLVAKGRHSERITQKDAAMKKPFWIALTLALVSTLSVDARADDLTLNSWVIFEWDHAGQQVQSILAQEMDFYALGPAQINVTDGFWTGDAFTVFDNGQLLGTTGAVAATTGDGCNHPSACLDDPIYSHGSWTVAAGENDLTIDATTSPYAGGGNAWVESAPLSTTPEPESICLFGSGILSLAGILRLKLAR
jgi:hypothetical protein